MASSVSTEGFIPDEREVNKSEIWKIVGIVFAGILILLFLRFGLNTLIDLCILQRTPDWYRNLRNKRLHNRDDHNNNPSITDEQNNNQANHIQLSDIANNNHNSNSTCMKLNLNDLEKVLSGQYLTVDQLESLQDGCCNICLNDMEIDQSVHLTRCNHYFHTNCIRQWSTTTTSNNNNNDIESNNNNLLILNNNHCPTCRSKLISDEELG